MGSDPAGNPTKSAPAAFRPVQRFPEVPGLHCGFSAGGVIDGPTVGPPAPPGAPGPQKPTHVGTEGNVGDGASAHPLPPQVGSGSAVTVTVSTGPSPLSEPSRAPLQAMAAPSMS